MWKQIEATPPHLTYLIVSAFLILYALFSLFIRNRLHLSEPPLAMLTGLAFGPKGVGAINPTKWGLDDGHAQEITRVIVGLQVFAVGLELPKGYLRKQWFSILMLIGPVMTIGWAVCALVIFMLFETDIPTALTIAACLTPTDPVLAASVLSNSRFSNRVPKRIKNLLSTESGCNDGSSFPFLYMGLVLITKTGAGSIIKEWVLITILWQCLAGTVAGIVIGIASNKAMRFADDRKLIGHSSFLVFYFLLAIFSVGVGSILGLDDFLVAFSAAVTFAYDGWFAERTRESKLNSVLDLMINSSFFVYLGAVIPWSMYTSSDLTPEITPWKLIILLILILLFRRIPVVLAFKAVIPAIKTWQEALFCGHFGPMGVGALFLAIEARAVLETGTAEPLPKPIPGAEHEKPIGLIWPIVTFVVFGSTLVHGLSVAAISLFVHFRRGHEHRSHEVGGERDPLDGMIHEGSEEDSEEEDADGDSDSGEGEDAEYEEELEVERNRPRNGASKRNRIALPA